MDVLEGPREVQLIVVADKGRDLADGQPRLLQQLGGAGHPVVQQVGLGAFAHRPAEHLAEIAAVEAADLGDLLDRDIALEVLLDEGQRLLDVKVAQAVLPGGWRLAEDWTSWSRKRKPWAIRWVGLASAWLTM